MSLLNFPAGVYTIYYVAYRPCSLRRIGKYSLTFHSHSTPPARVAKPKVAGQNLRGQDAGLIDCANAWEQG